ncbi:hypothetical protein H6P81_000739 [Aristolochia fimbriata]|uniref:Uncharacterized protein n=1 Tax=Aristolochia fimbriata TaxID=158543 RepID=A0AAV7F687_ARIFI|nr:hypothetical protein H6P81_000739 [Aristolochia fimbriata]
MPTKAGLRSNLREPAERLWTSASSFPFLLRRVNKSLCEIGSDVKKKKKKVEERERERMASEGLLRCVFEGCISSPDAEIERRPYHRNCSCALHKKRGSRTKCVAHNDKISYKLHKSWSEGCLVMAAAPSVLSSPSTSPRNGDAAASASASAADRTAPLINVSKTGKALFES